MAFPYPTVVNCPTGVSSITLPDGAHVPDANGNITDASNSDATILTYPPNDPKPVSTNLGNGQLTISLPPNISAITVNGVAKVPDGTQLNTITGPAADMTPLVNQAFDIVSSAAVS